VTQLPPTLVCFAVKEEANYFKQLSAAHEEISVLVTGMGATNARNAARAALSKRRPAQVITAGFAGGLVPELTFGTVVFTTDEGTELELRLQGAGARRARFHCAAGVVTTAQEKRFLHASTGAEAVEMESHYIHSLCQDQGIPAATVRVILDTAGEDLALDFNQLMTPDQKIDSGKLAMLLLRSPAKIAALLRLRKQSTAAARRLGSVLVAVLQLGRGKP
jgi:adenosylhomocysteine nucleosidase